MWRRFKLALEPLRHAGKLGGVLFQFLPWFFYRPGRRGRAACARDEAGGRRRSRPDLLLVTSTRLPGIAHALDLGYQPLRRVRYWPP